MTDSDRLPAGSVQWDAEEYETIGNDLAQGLRYGDALCEKLTPFTYATVTEQVILRLTFRWSEARE